MNTRKELLKEIEVLKKEIEKITESRQKTRSAIWVLMKEDYVSSQAYHELTYIHLDS